MIKNKEEGKWTTEKNFQYLRIEIITILIQRQLHKSQKECWIKLWNIMKNITVIQGVVRILYQWKPQT